MNPQPRPDPTTYLGGSDAAALCGIHPYKTPEDVVKEKLGMKEPVEQTYRMEKGLYLEDLIAKWYRTSTGQHLDRIGFLRHPKHEHLGGHPDFIRDVDGKAQLWGIKTTSNYQLYQDGPPDWHVCQEQHYAMILRETEQLHPEYGMIVDRGKEEPEIHMGTFDHEKLDKLRDEELAFWAAYVETRVLPDPHNTMEALARWPENTQEVVEFSDEDIQHVRTYHLMKGDEKNLKEGLEAERLFLQRKLGAAGQGVYKGKVCCTWLERDTSRLSVSSLKADPSPEAQALVEKHTFVNTTRVLLPKKVKS